MTDNKNSNEKQSGEKKQGKFHYNPGNMSGKSAGKVDKDEAEKQHDSDKVQER